MGHQRPIEPANQQSKICTSETEIRHLNLHLRHGSSTKQDLHFWKTCTSEKQYVQPNALHLTFAPKKPQPERLQIRLFHQAQDRALHHRDLASIIWKWHSLLWPRNSSQSIASTLIHEDRTLRHQDLDGISEIVLTVASNYASTSGWRSRNSITQALRPIYQDGDLNHSSSQQVTTTPTSSSASSSPM
jgi:hypothetical protein